MSAFVRGGITVKPHVQRAADKLEDALGIKLNFGTYYGHSPPEGPTQALDIFNGDNRAGYEQQDAICNYLLKHAKELGVRYVIRRTQIWNIERADEGWRQQGVTGDRTRDHYDHVHVTFYASASGIVKPKPIPTIGDDVMSLSVRYTFQSETPGEIGSVDWVFDGPSRIHLAVGTLGVLKACDKSGFPELGAVDGGTHEWFKAAASKWR